MTSLETNSIGLIGLGLNRGTSLVWAQRDSNPRPTAPQAAILSKLNYEPDYPIDVQNTKYELTPTLPQFLNIYYYALTSHDAKYLQNIQCKSINF
jgi:hypothetical protein